jgi:8-oxo-dGTP diphosphatase
LKRDFALAVKAIIIRDGRFLVLHRSKEEIKSSSMNHHVAWDLPGGGVRFSETAERGLFREVGEETNLKVSLVRILNCYDAIRSDVHLTILTYLCKYIDGEVKLSSEHDGYYWMTISDMRKMHLPYWMIRDFEDVYNEFVLKAD